MLWLFFELCFNDVHAIGVVWAVGWWKSPRQELCLRNFRQPKGELNS